jgi:hypothetical protein
MHQHFSHSPTSRYRLYKRQLLAACLAGAIASVCSAQSTTTARSYYLLGNDSSLAMVLDGTSGGISPAAAIVGLATSDQIVAIDVRPQTGQLYGLGQNPKTGTVQLYLLEYNRSGATAVPVGSAGSFVDAAGAPVLINANGFDMDFNPSVDRLRVVTTGGLNFRINPNNGALVDGDLGGAAGSVAGVNPDGRLNIAASPAQAMGTAYTNNEINASVTTQYALDAINNAIYIQQPPNAGTLISPLTITIAGQPFDFANDGGLDIAPGINVSTGGQAASGEAAAVLTRAGSAKLYTIDLATGAATERANLTSFAAIDLAVIDTKPGALALSSFGTQLFRFALDTPATVATANVTGVAANERLVGMDLRPKTGQIYALGINGEMDRGTLYRLEPQSAGGTAMATAIGTVGQIAFVDSTGQSVDLSDISHGVDFNPVADRLRVVDASGLNFRINPDTGAPVDGNTTDAGTNPDGMIAAPLGTQLGATAYTNASAAPSVTTQYTIDQSGGVLSIQNPPNSGTQTAPTPITLSGQPLSLGGAVGFDIPAGVQAFAANQAAVGNGYFTSNDAAGRPSLYQLDLTTAVATRLGDVATAGAELDSLIVSKAPLRFALDSNSVAVNESATPVPITIRRSTGGAAIVSYRTIDGTALAGSDYQASQGVLSFGAADASTMINLSVLQDGIDEPEESFQLELRLPSGELQLLTIRIVADQLFANGFE